MATDDVKRLTPTDPALPLVSVVTPVYNGARYLRDCIDSVLDQTYANWDLTVVNNCSTDGTLELAQEYAARDSRIRVHTNDSFVPVMENYNNALRQISPESRYCKVVAADDRLASRCLELMVGLAEEHPTVGIVGAYQQWGDKLFWTGLDIAQRVMPGREAARCELLGGPYVLGNPTAVIYRASLVRGSDPFFDESHLHADTEACLRSFERCDFGFVHQILTFGRDRGDSLTSFSGRFDTYLPGQLHALVTYGPKFLEPREIEDRTEVVLSQYYRCLAKALLAARPREYWRYHSAKMAEVELALDKPRLASAVVRLLGTLARNPRSTLKTIGRVAGRAASSRTAGASGHSS